MARKAEARYGSARSYRKRIKGPDGKFDPARPVYARHLKKAKARRRTRGRKLLEVFRRELDLLLPEFEKAGVTLL